MRGASGDDSDAADGSEGAADRADSTATPNESSGSSNPGDASTATSPDDAGTPDAAGAPDDAGTVDVAGTPREAGTLDVDPAELTVSERSLHPRIRLIWIARAVLWSLILGAIVTAVAWQVLEVTLLVPAVITVALLVLFVSHAVLRYRAWQYEFREDAIYLERGVVTRVRTVVPFVRIQHVDTARGPIARAAGLSSLVVYTAGSRGADVTIPGIEAERATEHQRRLKQLAIAAEDDTAV